MPNEIDAGFRSRCCLHILVPMNEFDCMAHICLMCLIWENPVLTLVIAFGTISSMKLSNNETFAFESFVWTNIVKHSVNPARLMTMSLFNISTKSISNRMFISNEIFRITKTSLCYRRKPKWYLFRWNNRLETFESHACSLILNDAVCLRIL